MFLVLSTSVNHSVVCRFSVNQLTGIQRRPCADISLPLSLPSDDAVKSKSSSDVDRVRGRATLWILEAEGLFVIYHSPRLSATEWLSSIWTAARFPPMAPSLLPGSLNANQEIEDTLWSCKVLTQLFGKNRVQTSRLDTSIHRVKVRYRNDHHQGCVCQGKDKRNRWIFFCKFQMCLK